MKFWYLLSICIVLHGDKTSGLRCWKCENARTEKECIEKGYSQQCRHTETVCQTEVRYSVGWGKRPMIRTSCKEGHACNDNFVQNPQSAWGPTQCNGGRFNSVCRCCCNESLCNTGDLLCERPGEPIKTASSTIGPRDVPTMSRNPVEGSCRRLPKVPNRGKVTCTNGMQLSSRCTFTCDEGYELVGRRAAVCFKFPKRPMWNRRTPICRKRIEKCRPVSTPTNGGVTCSSSRLEVGTVCKFSCNNGLLLKGAPDTTCVKISTTPRWDRETPSCIGICDSISAPENGRVICSESNEAGKATCDFRCNDGYQLIGFRTTSCIDTTKGPEWDRDVPTCRGLCDPIPAPENGRVDCTGSNEVDKAVCVFRCNNGLQLVGFETSSCIDTTKGPEWSRDTPKCTGFCDAITAPEYGEVECSGPNDLGTTCAFFCDDGLQIKGAAEITCVLMENGARWNDSVPTCNGTCRNVEVPENGFVECTGSGELGTNCDFFCEDGMEMEGSTITSCEMGPDGPQWSNESPKCAASPKCPAMGNLRNGLITCTGDDNEVGTTCSFECTTEGYDLLPIDRISTDCEAVPNGLSRWTKLKPCCNAQCPPVAKRDIVIVVDSSSSITKTEFAVMKRFLVDIIRTFDISDDAVRIAAFRFNRRIDTQSQILFGDYETKEELVAAVQKIPKNGGGTFIGRALRHAQRNVLTVNNRLNVTDMVFLMTDGQSRDDFKETAKELRDSGVQIVALGIFKNRRAQILPELIEMTGHEDLVLEVKDVLESSQSDLVNLVVDKICEISCE